MDSQDECFSQRTAFCTAGTHKPIEVKKQSLARVAHMMGAINEENARNAAEDKRDLSKYDQEFDGDEIDDDLVFSTVPQRSSVSVTKNIHFDEIDDDEMRRFAESFEQEQQDVKIEDSDPMNGEIDDDQLCEDYARKLQTPTKSMQTESKKRKEPSIDDLDALLNNDDDDDGNENTIDFQMQPQQMSPVFKKKS